MEVHSLCAKTQHGVSNQKHHMGVFEVRLTYIGVVKKRNDSIGMYSSVPHCQQLFIICSFV